MILKYSAIYNNENLQISKTFLAQYDQYLATY